MTHETVDGEYVARLVCPICGDDVAIALHRRLRKVFPRGPVVDPTQVCDACREKYLADGVMLINPRSGSFAVLKLEAFERLFDVPVPKGRIAFAEDDLLRFLEREAAAADAAAEAAG